MYELSFLNKKNINKYAPDGFCKEKFAIVFSKWVYPENEKPI